VRKVQSAGRNQSLVIHTATGRHLAELQAKFADVGCSIHDAPLGEPVENLRNLGPATAGEALKARKDHLAKRGLKVRLALPVARGKLRQRP